MRLTSNSRFESGTNKVRYSTQTKIENVFNSGTITRREHLDLTSALLADHTMTDRDRLQINQIIELVQSNKLELTD
jgi:hypothetical protein